MASSMFLRFTIPQQDEQSGVASGVFHAVYALADDVTVPDYERELIYDALDWYRQNLRIPHFLKDAAEPRAICWFRDSAVEHVRRMWDLIWLLRERGIGITLHRTDRPGQIVYEDEAQVAARPWAATWATRTTKHWAGA